jgi:protein-disulfide isomerase
MRAFIFLLTGAAMLAQTPMANQKMVAQNTPAAKKKVVAAVAKAPAAVQNYKMAGPTSAPLTIEVYTDYECPSCRNLYLQTIPSLMTQYVATGKVQLLHRDFPLSMHQFSKLAARYANAAGQLGQYELVVNQIFKTQPEWSQNGNVDGQVAKVLDAATMQKVRDMVKNDTHLDETVTADVAQGTRDNLNQTPTMIFVSKGKRTKVDGFMPFPILKTYIDQQLAK